jgi:hypothetical protein
MPAALILFGVGYAHTIHWFGLIVAATVLCATLVFGCMLPIQVRSFVVAARLTANMSLQCSTLSILITHWEASVLYLLFWFVDIFT